MENQGNTAAIKQFISENGSLFWHTPEEKKENISKEFLVETILNYGDMDTIKRLFFLMGIEQVSALFYNLKGRKKLNYYPEIYNYFSLVFHRYVQGDFK